MLVSTGPDFFNFYLVSGWLVLHLFLHLKLHASQQLRNMLSGDSGINMPDKSKEKETKKKDAGYKRIFLPTGIKKLSGNIFCAVTFQREQFLDPVAVVALQLNGISFYRTATSQFALHIF